jgi:hypothetical protein
VSKVRDTFQPPHYLAMFLFAFSTISYENFTHPKVKLHRGTKHTCETMRLPPGINSRYAYLFGIVLISFWVYIFSFVLTPYDFSMYILRQKYLQSTEHSGNLTTLDAFDFPPLDSHAIRLVCENVQWDPAIVFTCDNSVGGVGNIRNSILNCVRYSISAGGSMVIPRIVMRNSGNIAKIRTGERTGMDYMFDVEHFVNSLKLSCPQLTLYRYVDAVPNRAQGSGPVALLPESLVDQIPKTGLKHPEAWRQQFFEWLGTWSGLKPATMETPILIDLGRSYLQYPIYTDGEEFALSFGNILKFRADVRRIATKALQNLILTYNRSTDLSQPVLINTFFGAHLRTEKDAVEAWPAQDWKYQRYEVQSESYLKKLKTTGLNLIYVASGNQSGIARFSRDAATYNVTTKFMLLDAEDRQYLKDMAWDQQGLVDFLVMTKSSSFVGIGHSSFAWNIALKRHTFSQKKTGYLDGPEILNDELSVIYGVPHGYPEYAACLWP